MKQNEGKKEKRGSHHHFGPMKRTQTPPSTNQSQPSADVCALIGCHDPALTPPPGGRSLVGGRGKAAFLGGSSSPHLPRAASGRIRTHPHASTHIHTHPHLRNRLVVDSIRVIIYSIIIELQCQVSNSTLISSLIPSHCNGTGTKRRHFATENKNKQFNP